MLKNIIFNIIGKFWAILSTFIFIPYYLRILGVDNFSIISLSLIIVGILLVFDLGFSSGVTREMARNDTSNEDKFRAFITLEKLYFFLFLICASSGLLLAYPLANNFIQNTPIAREIIALCLCVIAIEASLQLYFRFYYSALMGLERQVAANLFMIGLGILRNGGAIGFIMLWPTLPNFFFWQLASTFTVLILIKLYLLGVMRKWKTKILGFFDFSVISRIRGFVTGVLMISIVAVINTQADRLIITHLMPLQQLSYYTIAGSVGLGILAISSPFLSAVQPKLIKMYSDGDLKNSQDIYLRISTLVSVLVFPMMAVVSFNPEIVILTWTGNKTVAEQASPILPWIAASYSFLAISSLTYGVALANAYTRYNNVIGIITLAISVPGYFYFIDRFGLIGSAGLFCILQLITSTVYQFLVNRRFIKLGFLRTYFQIFLVPALISIISSYLMQEFFINKNESRFSMLTNLACTYFFVVIATAGCTAMLSKALHPWLKLNLSIR